MSLLIICKVHQKISTIFWPFLAIFTLFHLKKWLWSKILPVSISGTPKFLFPLVNNAGKWCQSCCIKSFPLALFLGIGEVSSPHLVLSRHSHNIESGAGCQCQEWRCARITSFCRLQTNYCLTFTLGEMGVPEQPDM